MEFHHPFQQLEPPSLMTSMGHVEVLISIILNNIFHVLKVEATQVFSFRSQVIREINLLVVFQETTLLFNHQNSYNLQ
jgi:hypothetical protein